MRWQQRLTTAALLLAFASGVLLFLSGPGHRFELWGLPVAFNLFKYAAFGAGVAALLALVALLAGWRMPQVRRRAGIGLLIGVAVALIPGQLLRVAKSVPPIHDISTDTVTPPQFVAVLPLRADAPNTAVYSGAELATQQREAYPDIQTLSLTLTPQQAFAAALDAARGMDWEIVSEAPAEGRIEATATTFWFGYKDDVVVRVAAADVGSKIDVRSVSRVGQRDLGANAKRIRAYLAALRNRAAAP